MIHRFTLSFIEHGKYRGKHRIDGCKGLLLKFCEMLRAKTGVQFNEVFSPIFLFDFVSNKRKTQHYRKLDDNLYLDTLGSLNAAVGTMARIATLFTCHLEIHSRAPDEHEIVVRPLAD